MTVFGLIVIGIFWIAGVKAEIIVDNCVTATQLLTQPSGGSSSWTVPNAISDGVLLNAIISPNIAPPVKFNAQIPISFPITYTWMDGSGNMTECVITLYVVEVPAITVENCPQTGVLFSLVGSEVELTWIEPTAVFTTTGEELEPTKFGSAISPGFLASSPATYTVIYFWTDGGSNTEQCTVTLQVVAPPAITVSNCYHSAVTTLPPDYLSGGTLELSWTEPTATLTTTGELLVPTISGSISPGELVDSPGTYTLTYLWTDGGSSPSIEQCTISLVVVEPPAITVMNCDESPMVYTLPSDNRSGGAVQVSWIEPTAVLASTGQTLQPMRFGNAPHFTTSVASTFRVTYTWTDGGSLTELCLITLQVVASPVTVFNCEEVPMVFTLPYGIGGIVEVTWTEPTAILTDAPGNPTLAPTGDILSSPLYANTSETFQVEYTWTDGMGYSTTCIITLQVVPPPIDAENPIILGLPMDITVDTTSNEEVVTWVAPSASDNSGTVTLSATHQSGSIFPLGTTIVRYTAMDQSGNTATASFNVIIQDIEFPTISGVPEDIILSSTSNEIEVVWTEPSASDNSGIVTLSSDYASGSRFPLGITTVIYTAIDPIGNTETASFTITIQDIAAPECSNIPDDIIRDTDSGQPTAIVNWTPPTFTDNSGVLTMSSDYVPGDSFPIGRTVVMYSAIDSTGLTNMCGFNIDIQDGEAPECFNIPEDIIRDTNPGQPTAVVNWTPPTFTDNSGVLTTSSDYVPGDSFPIGRTEVMYSAIDPTGLTIMCGFNIVIQDIAAPEWSNIPDDITRDTDPGQPTAVVNWSV